MEITKSFKLFIGAILFTRVNNTLKKHVIVHVNQEFLLSDTGCAFGTSVEYEQFSNSHVTWYLSPTYKEIAYLENNYLNEQYQLQELRATIKENINELENIKDVETLKSILNLMINEK